MSGLRIPGVTEEALRGEPDERVDGAPGRKRAEHARTRSAPVRCPRFLRDGGNSRFMVLGEIIGLGTGQIKLLKAKGIDFFCPPDRRLSKEVSLFV